MLIDRIWKEQPGKFGCISTLSASKKWEDHFFTRKEFRRAGTLERFIAANADKDLYFCPHLFSKPRRVKENAVLPKLLWSDLDEADPRDIKIKPTFAIQSSPGRYVGLWRLTETMTESLNRRLAYLLGADVSGWDLTQVLRIPNTTNYKYASTPKTKTLWSDGPEWTIKAIEKLVPDDEEIDATGAEETDAAEVLKAHEKSIPHWCLRELRTKKLPPEGKRSEMLWKIGNALAESGLKSHEVFVLLKASVWNKFRGRHSEDKQLKREVDKVINRKHQAKQTVSGEDEEDDDKPNITSVSLDSVEVEDIDWLWYPYLAKGEITILEGDPEAGKSYIAQMVSGCVMSGKQLPFSTDKTECGRVLYFDLENDPARVTKKRLLWNGFKTEDMKNFHQVVELFSVDDDESMEQVNELMEKIKPSLCVFDTLNTYIGAANTSQGAQSQQSFMRFVKLARRFECAVLVLRHLTKGSRDKAMYRGQGNISFSAVARQQILAARHPEEPDLRVFVMSKCSNAAKPPAYSYEILGKKGTGDRDASQIKWGEACDLTADDVVAAVEGKADNSERDAAKKFLAELLAEGEMEFDKILHQAGTRSISERTLRRAAEDLKVEKTSTGFGKKKVAFWSLPD